MPNDNNVNKSFKSTTLTDRIIRQAFATDLTQELAFIGEHFHAVRPIVGDEDLLPVVHDDAIRKFCERNLWKESS